MASGVFSPGPGLVVSEGLFDLRLWVSLCSSVIRVTGHKALGESLVNITVSSCNTTYLQENPQRLE